MPNHGPESAAVRAGALELSVRYLRQSPDEMGGTRSQFAYQAAVGDRRWTGRDLYSGVGADVTAVGMLGVSASFLADAGERYRTGMCPPDDVYPQWLYEHAYLDADELAMVSAELEETAFTAPASGATPEAASASASPQRWVSIVFQQGEDADHALELLHEHGPEAVIEHLSQWDYGKETELAARVNGHEYAAPPADAAGREHLQGDYHLSWNHALGHVALTRRLPETEQLSPGSSRTQALSVDRKRLLGAATPVAAPSSEVLSRESAVRD